MDHEWAAPPAAPPRSKSNDCPRQVSRVHPAMRRPGFTDAELRRTWTPPRSGVLRSPARPGGADAEASRPCRRPQVAGLQPWRRLNRGSVALVPQPSPTTTQPDHDPTSVRYFASGAGRGASSPAGRRRVERFPPWLRRCDRVSCDAFASEETFRDARWPVRRSWRGVTMALQKTTLSGAAWYRTTAFPDDGRGSTPAVRRPIRASAGWR